MSEPGKRIVEVLVVDDDGGMLDILQRMVELCNATPVPASDYISALNLSATHKFAAMVVDVKLPGKSGFDLVRDLRRQGCHTPVLFISGCCTDNEHLLTGHALGCVGYMFKPILLPLFSAKISLCIDLFNKTEEVAELRLKIESLFSEHSGPSLNDEEI